MFQPSNWKTFLPNRPLKPQLYLWDQMRRTILAVMVNLKVGRYSHSPACCCLSLLCLSWVIFPLCWLLSDWWLDAFLPMSNTIRVKVILNSSTTTTTTIISSVCDGFYKALCQTRRSDWSGYTAAFQNGFPSLHPSLIFSFPRAFSLHLQRIWFVMVTEREKERKNVYSGRKKSLTPLNVFF